jgi:hypothetical protein
MTAILADTHAALWYLQASSHLSRTADAAMAEAVESGAGRCLASSQSGTYGPRHPAYGAPSGPASTKALLQ